MTVPCSLRSQLLVKLISFPNLLLVRWNEPGWALAPKPRHLQRSRASSTSRTAATPYFGSIHFGEDFIKSIHRGCNPSSLHLYVRVLSAGRVVILALPQEKGKLGNGNKQRNTPIFVKPAGPDVIEAHQYNRKQHCEVELEWRVPSRARRGLLTTRLNRVVPEINYAMN